MIAHFNIRIVITHGVAVWLIGYRGDHVFLMSYILSHNLSCFYNMCICLITYVCINDPTHNH